MNINYKKEKTTTKKNLKEKRNKTICLYMGKSKGVFIIFVWTKINNLKEI